MFPFDPRGIWQIAPRRLTSALALPCLLGFMVVGYGQPDNVSKMINQLKDPDVGVRRQAADALGEAKDPRAVEPLAAALKDSDAGVRRHAADALGEVKDPRAIESLTAALEDQDVSVRHHAADALNEIGLGKTDAAGRTAVLEAWHVEMSHVKADRPVHVNGFLVGSGGGVMGTIVLRKVLPNIESDAFKCTPVKPVKAGEEWSAFVADGQSWSMSEVQLGQFAYPVLAMIKTSDNQSFTVYPAILVAKIDIKPGEALHSGGYTVDTKRPIKAGDSINVLVVGSQLSILSIEETDGSKVSSESDPWFTAF